MPQHLRTARPHRHSLAFRRRNLRKGRLAGLLLVLLVAVPGVAACDFADKVYGAVSVTPDPACVK